MPGHQYIEKPIRKHTRQMVFTIIDRTFQTVRILAVNIRSFNLLSSAMSRERIASQHVEANYRSAFRERVVLLVGETMPFRSLGVAGELGPPWQGYEFQMSLGALQLGDRLGHCGDVVEV